MGLPIFEWIFQNAKDEDSRITENAAALIIREICLALETVRKKGIYHLDLRAENILVKNKCVGLNQFTDDDNFCPYNI